ncbi:peroxisomal sarcosine oxidase [Caerostris extrusa]|uniref:Peroxisomal sarcosine oxidase n=1 Tax=Caerostris extrusa TaxID=172846 RepID=A0AAV4QRV6_CAEEX|nr:peroxisomal sarcosine oxidase [Caerostris extrusa]
MSADLSSRSATPTPGEFPRGDPDHPVRLCRAFFCEMMSHALRMWSELEVETGNKLMENIGFLCIAKSTNEARDYESIMANMKRFCPESLDTTDPRIESLFSRLLNYDKIHAVLMDNSGGILRAQKAVLAVQALFRERGGDQWDNCQVLKIEPVDDESVKLFLEPQKVVTAKSVVVCAGAWTQKLLSPFLTLPVQASAVSLLLEFPKRKGAYSEKSGFPCLIDITEPHIYALPSYEYPGLVKEDGFLICLEPHSGQGTHWRTIVFQLMPGFQDDNGNPICLRFLGLLLETIANRAALESQRITALVNFPDFLHRHRTPFYKMAYGNNTT